MHTHTHTHAHSRAHTHSHTQSDTPTAYELRQDGTVVCKTSIPDYMSEKEKRM